MFHFYIETPNVADCISLALTGLGVTIALIGLIIAIKALDRWKNAKEADLLLDAKSRSNDAIYYLKMQVGEFEKFYFDIMVPTPQDNKLLVLMSEFTDRKRKYSKGQKKEFLYIQQRLKYFFTNKENPVTIYYDKISEYINLLDAAEDDIMVRFGIMIREYTLQHPSLDEIQREKKQEELSKKVEGMINKQKIEFTNQQIKELELLHTSATNYKPK